MKKTLVLIALLIGCVAVAQQLTTTVDRDTVYIGEQINLRLELQADSLPVVDFPKVKKLGSLEVIDTPRVDTIVDNSQFKLVKQYGLTSFDGGAYTIPAIEVSTNNTIRYTDSLPVYINEVKVDTAKQKMYTHKAAIDQEPKDPSSWFKWYYLLILALILGLLLYFLLFFKKKPKPEYEDTLPPYEWARYRLSQIDLDNVINNKSYKPYYTELSYILRKYIDSKVYGKALESTTSELLLALNNTLEEKNISLSDYSTQHIKEILERADLVKFAEHNTDAITVKQDKDACYNVLENIHNILPPPSEEELMQNALYRRKVERRRKVKQIITYTLGTLGVLLVGLFAWVLIAGQDNVKDQLLGNPLRDYYESKWAQASYGIPEVHLSTPMVLERIKQDSSLSKKENKWAFIEHFNAGKLGGSLYISVKTLALNKKKTSKNGIKKELIDSFYTQLQEKGAKNLTSLSKENKEEEYNVFYGTYTIEGEVHAYELRVYNTSGMFQLVGVAHSKLDEEKEDRQFGQLIKEKIFSSVEIEPIKSQEQ